MVRLNLETGEMTVLSKHSAPVRCVVYNKARGELETGITNRALFINTHARHPRIGIMGL